MFDLDYTDDERYREKMQEEIDRLNKDYKEPMSQGTLLIFIHSYELAARHWHQQGLIEGWNDHIEKLTQLMEPLGGKGDE